MDIVSKVIKNQISNLDAEISVLKAKEELASNNIKTCLKERKELADSLMFLERRKTPNFEELHKKVLQWANEKQILLKGNPEAQHSKTLEEVQELTVALSKQDFPEIVDAIGDIIVTLIIQAEMQNIDPVDCLQSAYNVISKRTGSMKNGTFVKDE